MRHLFAALFLALGLPAFADDAAVPAAPDDSALAPPHCAQPALPSEEPPDNRASHIRSKSSTETLNQQIQGYQACMRAYVDMQGELSRRHIAAANAAVKEVNDFGQKLNEVRSAQ